MNRTQAECPSNFEEFKFTHFLKIDDDRKADLWDRLNRRETFVEGQVFPYRVEFENGHNEGFFEANELNIHHGPLLSVHGAIGEVGPQYRSLNYFYGSYVISFRLVRPTKLEFFQTDDGMRMDLTAFVAPWFLPFWKYGNAAFWKLFESLLKS